MIDLKTLHSHEMFCVVSPGQLQPAAFNEGHPNPGWHWQPGVGSPLCRGGSGKRLAVFLTAQHETFENSQGKR